MNKTLLISIIVLVLLGLGAYFLFQTESQPIGGDRDKEGCLVAGGYSFDEEVGACTRSFELTPDIREAARIAVESVGRGYTLTVASFNSYEEQGAYDIFLERGEERERETVYIRDWEVVAPSNIELFYYSDERDLDENGNIQCSRQGLVAVKREIVSVNIIEDTIRMLLSGELTTEERAQGISTEYPLAGLNLASAKLGEEGVLTFTFDDPQNRTGGGACRVGVLWFQIEATALQFPEVKQVRFAPEELFQP
jgi:hypothetical protein